MKKLTAIILAVAMLASLSCASAAPDSSVAPTSTKASYYLDNYSLCMMAQGDGLMSITYTVCGVDYMDKVGAMEILVEERIGNNWYETMTFDGDEDGLYAYDTYIHSGDVYFYGFPGTTYRATMTVYAELDGGYDTGTITCASKVCV